MATQPDDMLDDDLPQNVEQEEVEQDNDDADHGEQNDQPPEDEHDEITFGDTAVSAGEEESEGVRNLRKRLREREQELKQLRGTQAAPDIGEKPTLESCDYDDDRYERELIDWRDRKRKADDEAEQQQALAQSVEEDVQASQRAYETQRASLKVPGFDAADDAVTEALPPLFLNAVNVAAGPKAAALRFYLGTHADELDKLKALDPRKVTDLIRLSGLVGQMAEKINVQRRKPTTTPEQQHRGQSGAGGGAGDTKLARLEREADKTNDRTALIAYKRQLRERERA